MIRRAAIPMVVLGGVALGGCSDGTECPDLLCGGTACKCEKIDTMCNCLPGFGVAPHQVEPIQPLTP